MVWLEMLVEILFFTSMDHEINTLDADIQDHLQGIQLLDEGVEYQSYV